jgi:WD40 repeat protein
MSDPVIEMERVMSSARIDFERPVATAISKQPVHRQESICRLRTALCYLLLLVLLVSSAHAQTFRGAISVPDAHDVLHLALSPDRSMLAAIVCTENSRQMYQLHLYDADSRKQLGRIPLPAGSWYYKSLLEFSPDGRTFYTCCSTERKPCTLVQFWDVKTCKERHSIKLPLGQGIRGHLSPDGKSILLLGMGRAWLYDTDKRKELSSFEIVKDKRLRFSVLSPDGKLVAIGGESEGKVFLYELSTGKSIMTVTVFDNRGIPGLCIASIFFSRDSKQLICLNTPCHLMVFDIPSGMKRSDALVLGIPSSRQGSAALTADGKSLIVRKPEGAGFGMVDLGTGKLQQVGVPLGQARYISQCMAVSRDGNLVAVANKDIRIWSLKAKDEEP